MSEESKASAQRAKGTLYELLDIALKVTWIVALGKYIGWWG